MTPTLSAIAGHLQVAPSTLSRCLNGQSQPGADLLARIAHAFPDAYGQVILVLPDGQDAAARDEDGATW